MTDLLRSAGPGTKRRMVGCSARKKREAPEIQLRALDRRCSSSFWREEEWLLHVIRDRYAWMGIRQPGAAYRRSWRVRIHLGAGCRWNGDFIDTSEPLIADALLKAVEKAEGWGWDQPAVTSSPPRTC